MCVYTALVLARIGSLKIQHRHVLGVHDFGKASLQAMASGPDLRNRQDCPIVLIGHSMGGLVIKWASLDLRTKTPN